MKSKTKSYIWDIFAAFVYVALGVLGLRLASLNASVSPIWPAAGWALAILQFRGFRAWPIVFIGAVITNLTTGSAILSSIVIAFGNTSEALAGLYLIKFLEKKSSQQFALRDLTSMLVIALVSPVTAATVGTTTLYGTGIVPAAAIKDVWLTWWTGDGLGVLVFYPLMSSITNQKFKDVFVSFKGKVLVQISWITTAIVCGYWVFGSEGNGEYLACVLLPILVAVIVGGEVSGHLAVWAVCGWVIYGTISGYGPFTHLDQNSNLLNSQLFMGTLALTCLALLAIQKFFSVSRLVPILIGGWLILGLLFGSIYLNQRTRNLERTQQLNKSLIDAISDRSDELKILTNAQSSAFQINPQIEPQSWAEVMNTTQIAQRYSEVYKVLLVRFIDQQQLRLYLSNQQKNYSVKFKLRDLKGQEIINTFADRKFGFVTYEYSRADQKWLGYDLLSDPHLKNAFLSSRKVSTVTVSDRLAIGNTQVVHFIRPIAMLPSNKTYKSQGSAFFYGWIDLVVDLKKLFNSAHNLTSKQLDFKIFESSDFSDNNILFQYGLQSSSDLQNGRSFMTTPFQLGNKKLYLQSKRSTNSLGSVEYGVTWVMCLGGLIVVLISWFWASFQSQHQVQESKSTIQAQTILEKELVWSALTKSAPVGIFQTDKQGSLTYMNAQGLTLSGMTVEQALGYGWLDAIHPEDRPWFEKSWFEAVKLNRYFDLQVRMAYSEPNNEVWIRAIASSIADSNGHIQGYIGIYTDVSDHVRHQKELESERVKMIESSKLATLGEMAGGIAHEINNPLAIIVGRTNIITSYLKRASVIEREKIQENIDKIEVTAQRIAKIVKGLKSFSRNAENDPLSPCSLDSIIEDSLGLCEEKLKNRNIQLHINTRRDFTIMARPSQVSQVVLNLINNSADAIEGSPNPWIIVDVVATGTSLFLSIMDSGKGIPEEIAKKIMNPFFTTKEVGKGTGLGLSIGKGIIEGHGGKLYLDRNSPHTKFIIELPLDEKIQRAA